MDVFVALLQYVQPLVIDDARFEIEIYQTVRIRRCFVEVIHWRQQLCSSYSMNYQLVLTMELVETCSPYLVVSAKSTNP